MSCCKYNKFLGCFYHCTCLDLGALLVEPITNVALYPEDGTWTFVYNYDNNVDRVVYVNIDHITPLQETLSIDPSIFNTDKIITMKIYRPDGTLLWQPLVLDGAIVQADCISFKVNYTFFNLNLCSEEVCDTCDPITMDFGMSIIGGTSFFLNVNQRVVNLFNIVISPQSCVGEIRLSSINFIISSFPNVTDSDNIPFIFDMTQIKHGGNMNVGIDLLNYRYQLGPLKVGDTISSTWIIESHTVTRTGNECNYQSALLINIAIV